MFKFQSWKVYSDARILRKDIEKHILSKLPAKEKFALIDQMRRAMNSVILNIAEGSFRGSSKDFIHFLTIAAASLYEVVSCFDLCLDSNYIHGSEHKEYIERCEELVKQISAFARYINNHKL